MNDQTKHDGQAAMPPVAWVRYCSDGGIEGPILDNDSRMDGIRREFWTPLFAAQQSASAQPLSDSELGNLIVSIADSNGFDTKDPAGVDELCRAVARAIEARGDNARIADLELALFAENQKRQEVEQQRGQLLAALKAITYESGGRYFVGVHGDTDVTDEVAAAIAAGEAAQKSDGEAQ